MLNALLLFTSVILAAGSGAAGAVAPIPMEVVGGVSGPADSVRLVPHGFADLHGFAGTGEHGLMILEAVPAWLNGFIRSGSPLPDGARFRIRLSRSSFLLGCTLELSI